MDPFVYDNRHKGGDVYFDLGNVSEDILKDGRKAFENGLPAGPDIRHVDTTRWGRVPGVQSITNGFDNNSQARRYQDVGLDGMNDEDERIFYAAYLETLRRTFGENSKVYREAWNDPAGIIIISSGDRITMLWKHLYWSAINSITGRRVTHRQPICRPNLIRQQPPPCLMWKISTETIP